MFTGPDGVQYRWAMGAFGTNYPKGSLFSIFPGSSTLNPGPKLVAADENKVVAEFRRAHCIARNRRLDLKLGVQPAGMEMLDHIVLTFICRGQT